MNKFPGDEADDFASLRRDVEEIKALLRGGGSFTTASAGWVLPNMPHPANPSGGVHIYGNNNDLAVLTAGGTVKRIPGAAAAVAIVPNMTSGTIGGAPTMGQYNALYNDTSAIRTTVNDLITKLRVPGVIAT